LSLVGSGDTASFILLATSHVVFALVFALLASLVLLRFLPRLPFGQRLILERGLAAAKGYASAPASDAQLLGKTGKASSPLRPAGIAEIDGRRIDVVSEGELIEPGQFIQVTRVDGNRIVVRHMTNIDDKE
jgi:membrane-bound serine protease (ClpP class)